MKLRVFCKTSEQQILKSFKLLKYDISQVQLFHESHRLVYNYATCISS